MDFLNKVAKEAQGTVEVSKLIVFWVFRIPSPSGTEGFGSNFRHGPL